MLKQPPQIQVHIIIDQNQLDNVEYFKYLSSLITHDVSRTHETKFNIAWQKQFQPEDFFLPELCT